MSLSPEEVRKVYAEADRIYSLEQVEAAIDQMAAQISRRFAALDPLILCVMNGGLIPAGRLLTRLDFPLQLDYIHATRYRGETYGGELEWIKHHSTPLLERHVLIVDDILDEGYTLDAIVKACAKEGPAELASAVLTRKTHQRGVGFQADFVGLDAPDRYVFGYGMDYKGYLRNAPGIFAVRGL